MEGKTKTIQPDPFILKGRARDLDKAEYAAVEVPGELIVQDLLGHVVEGDDGEGSVRRGGGGGGVGRVVGLRHVRLRGRQPGRRVQASCLLEVLTGFGHHVRHAVPGAGRGAGGGRQGGGGGARKVDRVRAARGKTLAWHLLFHGRGEAVHGVGCHGGAKGEGVGGGSDEGGGRVLSLTLGFGHGVGEIRKCWKRARSWRSLLYLCVKEGDKDGEGRVRRRRKREERGVRQGKEGNCPRERRYAVSFTVVSTRLWTLLGLPKCKGVLEWVRLLEGEAGRNSERVKHTSGLEARPCLIPPLNPPYA